MPRAFEIPTSRSGSDNAFDLTFGVEGTIDDLEAEGLAAAKAPISHRGLPRNPIPTMSSPARGIFEFTYAYRLDDAGEQQDGEPQGELPTIGSLSIEPAGGTQHITQALVSHGYSTGINLQKIVDTKVIGLHKDGVHGCDIEAPGSIITLERMYLPQAITGPYIESLKRLRGKANIAPYMMRWGRAGTRYELQYAARELLFLGPTLKTSITPAGISAWTIGFKWFERDNQTDVKFGSADDYTPGGGPAPTINVPFIGGHDYVWAYYDKKEITGALPATIEVPKAMFVAEVYPLANFVDFLGF